MLYRILPAVTVIVSLVTGCGDDVQLMHVFLTPDAPPSPGPAMTADFTETFSPASMDIGNWGLTTQDDRARLIHSTGGAPDGYLYGEVSSSIPTWATASTRYQPGVTDDFKRDSVFVGDYYTRGINHISADLQVYQVGVWTPDRGVTLHMMRWDGASNSVAFEAFYTVLELTDVPAGWAHHDIEVDARSTTVPPGWEFTRGDGTPGTDAEWATFMHQIDLVGFGLWKPHVAYPDRGIWQLGIDNIHVGG